MTTQNQPPAVVPTYNQPMPMPTWQLPTDFDAENQEQDLKAYFHVLIKRKWWIICSFVCVFLVAAIYTFLRTPVFRAAATLQITQDNPGSNVSMDDRLSSLTGSGNIEKFQQTQYQILQSRSLAARVIKVLDLGNRPEFKPNPKKKPAPTEGQIENNIVDYFLKNLEVKPVRNTYLVEVAFKSPDKELCQKVVNAIADEYMYLSIDRRNESFSLVRRWLEKQLGDMANKVQLAQQKLYKFGQKTDIYTLDEKDNVIVQKYIDLSGLLTKAEAEKMAKEAQYQQIRVEGPNAPLIVNNPLVAGLRQQLVIEQAKISSMKKIFRGGHPDLQAEFASKAELNNRLNAEVRRLQESVKADYEAARRTEKLISDSYSAQNLSAIAM